MSDKKRSAGTPVGECMYCQGTTLGTRQCPKCYEIEYSSDKNLGASEIACAVADAWAAYWKADGAPNEHNALMLVLSRLEAATRGSAMRRVRP